MKFSIKDFFNKCNQIRSFCVVKVKGFIRQKIKLFSINSKQVNIQYLRNFLIHTPLENKPQNSRKILIFLRFSSLTIGHILSRHKYCFAEVALTEIKPSMKKNNEK